MIKDRQKKRRPAAHFIGIGGIGVSALARWFLSQGWKVSGSDLNHSGILHELRREGIRISTGHTPGNVPRGATVVIRSQAIPRSNPEIAASKRLGIAVRSYPEEVGELTKRYTTLAIAGAHGKSTTTALLALMLRQAKIDPTVIVGTKLRELGNKNFHLGKSPYLVLEADEYGRAFHNYFSAIAIVTNIDREHLEIFGGLAGVKRAFLKFLANVNHGGILVLNRDDSNLRSLAPRIKTLAVKNGYRIIWYSLKGGDARKLKGSLKILGRHNLSNAVAAATAARLVGASWTHILRAVRSYHGAWRRMEYRGKFGGADLFDDYAHHPSEIAATLQAFRDGHPHASLICVFQPHHAGRLSLLFREFSGSFREADALVLLPLYHVAGRDGRTEIDGEALFQAVRKKFPKKRVTYARDPKHLRGILKRTIASLPSSRKKVVVMMGAGNIVELSNHLLG